MTITLIQRKLTKTMITVTKRMQIIATLMIEGRQRMIMRVQIISSLKTAIKTEKNVNSTSGECAEDCAEGKISKRVPTKTLSGSSVCYAGTSQQHQCKKFAHGSAIMIQ
jgi:hypothetical protein